MKPPTRKSLVWHLVKFLFEMLFKILENISSSWITKKGYHAKKWVCLKMRDTPQKTEKRRPRFVGNRLDLGTSKHCLRHTDIPWHTAICVSLIRIDINTNTCRYIIMLYMYVDINTIYFYIYVYIYIHGFQWFSSSTNGRKSTAWASKFVFF